ncbi:phosphoribosyl-AMP cyclohydrolase [Casimicrobium huifangae]|uniref:phosphoribosyl-AMP cyclohydrolase n=1 Tax=Casimicrobium huifangae TaxID=2591109 RepID=UPI0037842E34
MSDSPVSGPAVLVAPISAAALAEVRFDAQGLIPAIAQDAVTNEILMVAWMDRDALLRTLSTGRACYYSRSRRSAWMKGESSGHLQILREIRIDCDGDVVLMKVDQLGGIACHTGRRNCFYRKLENGDWVNQFEPVKSEAEIYGER